MAEMKKAGCLASMGQPALASIIPAGQEHPFSAACVGAANGGERMVLKKTSASNSAASEEGSVYPRSPYEGCRPTFHLPPDPNHPMVAYRGPSMTRAGTAGLLKSGPPLGVARNLSRPRYG